MNYRYTFPMHEGSLWTPARVLGCLIVFYKILTKWFSVKSQCNRISHNLLRHGFQPSAYITKMADE